MRKLGFTGVRQPSQDHAIRKQQSHDWKSFSHPVHSVTNLCCTLSISCVPSVRPRTRSSPGRVVLEHRTQAVCRPHHHTLSNERIISDQPVNITTAASGLANDQDTRLFPEEIPILLGVLGRCSWDTSPKGEPI